MATLVITSGRDTALQGNNPDFDWTTSSPFVFGKVNLLQLYSLFYFDITALPANANISAAVLQVVAQAHGSANPLIASIHRLTNDFYDGPVGPSTFNKRRDNGGVGDVFWAGGGAVTNADYNAAVVATINFLNIEQAYTANILTLVQAWFGGTANQGLIFVASSVDAVLFTFIYAREDGVVGNRPILTITYTRTINGVVFPDRIIPGIPFWISATNGLNPDGTTNPTLSITDSNGETRVCQVISSTDTMAQVVLPVGAYMGPATYLITSSDAETATENTLVFIPRYKNKSSNTGGLGF